MTAGHFPHEALSLSLSLTVERTTWCLIAGYTRVLGFYSHGSFPEQLEDSFGKEGKIAL